MLFFTALGAALAPQFARRYIAAAPFATTALYSSMHALPLPKATRWLHGGAPKPERHPVTAVNTP